MSRQFGATCHREVELSCCGAGDDVEPQPNAASGEHPIATGGIGRQHFRNGDILVFAIGVKHKRAAADGPAKSSYTCQTGGIGGRSLSSYCRTSSFVTEAWQRGGAGLGDRRGRRGALASLAQKVDAGCDEHERQDRVYTQRFKLARVYIR